MSAKILFLDIETAPHKVYSWGLWDQNIATNQIEEPGYTLCWAAKWKGQRDILFNSVQEHTAKQMLRGIHVLLHMADIVVHYNGTKFDIPTLNHEFVQHGFRPPAPYKHVDLLKTARRRFRLASNKMDYVAKHLGLKGKLPNKGMDLWRGCMAGDPKAWAEMRRYNIQDVRLLEQIYEALLPWIPGHPNMGLWKPDDGRPVCTHCGSARVKKQGVARTKTLLYQQYSCLDCGAWMRDKTSAKPRLKGLVEHGG